ncbi:MAG: hypothetical protein JWO53_1172 [Chlamydiia bacterium]|nr:hypothetical protein [Chlamydiia bacterium]
MRIVIFFLLLFLNIGCSACQKQAETHPTTDMSEREKIASSHWLYKVIPRHRSQIEWYDIGRWTTWALFGNDDDGIFGEGKKANYKLQEPISSKLALYWTCRNPLHNFCFYVIGQAYMKNSEYTLLSISEGEKKYLSYKAEGSTVFEKGNSSFFLGFHGWKPFIAFKIQHSHSYHTEFYLGWRERGNFGLKLIPLKSYTKP